MNTKRALMSLLIISSFVYLFILQIYVIWPFTIDDMYISLRYAKHWADGVGLYWNMGEAAVEGYSNFSFVYFARWAIHFKLNPVTSLKMLGIVGLFLSGVATFLLTRFWALPRFAWIPCAWLFAYYGEILWSVSGLETTLYQACLIFSVVYLFWGLGFRFYPAVPQPASLYPFMAAGALMAIASLTRPEAPALMILFVVLLIGISFSQKRESHCNSWPGIALFIGIYTLLFLPYFLWRWHFFGRLFPNPVYCKALTGSTLFVLDYAYLKLLWPFLLLASLSFLPQRRHEITRDHRHYFLWLPSILYLILLIDADQIVAFDNRLFLPVFALFLPFAFQGLQAVCHLYKEQWMIYVIAFLFMIYFIPMKTLAGYRYFTQTPIAGEHLRQNVAHWLIQNTSEKNRIVLADSGLIPYQTPRYFIDSYCLNNADMTRSHMKNMYTTWCHKILQNKPDIIILTALITQGQTIYTPMDACFVKAFKKNNDYQWQQNFSYWDKHILYQYQIYRSHLGYSKIRQG